MKKPIESWIRRDIELVTVTVRIDKDVKRQAEDAASKFDTSLNRFAEAALKWYVDALKKEESSN